MSIFEGLQSYEIVLLIMGVLFFLALLFFLTRLILQKRPYMGLLPFFAFPVVMVGFPGIQKIVFDKGVVEIERLTKDVEKDPKNGEAKKQLETRLHGIGDRPVAQRDTMRILQRAYSAVGNQQKADDYRARLSTVRPVP